MNLLEEIFGNFFNIKKDQYIRYAKAGVHRNTVGKVNGEILKIEGEVDSKIFSAQRKIVDKVTLHNQGQQQQQPQQGKQGNPPPAKMPQAPPQGKNMGLFGDGKKPAGGQRPPQGQPQPQGHPGSAPPPDPYWGGQPQPYGQGAQGGQPNYGGGADKTAAIDIRGLEKSNERQLVGWVVAVSGAHRGQDFRVYSGKNIVGTSADCDIVVTDAFLSARHCTIRYENGNFTVIDLDSRNGTYVNQKKITKDELIDNDTLRIGKTEFKFKALC